MDNKAGNKIEPGAVFYHNIGRACHVVHLFNDKREEIVVYKFWYHQTKEWCYKAIKRDELERGLDCHKYRSYR